MDIQAKINWHAKLIDKLGWPCRIDDCKTPAERLRYRVNPVWGIDRDGETLLSEEDFLAEVHDLVHAGGTEYEPAFQIEQVQALCLPHFEATLPKSGGGTLGKPDQLGDQGAGPSGNQMVKARDARGVVLGKLGPACKDCGVTSVDRLQVILKPEQPADFWASIGANSWWAKYAMLAAEANPQDLVEVVCGMCAQVRVSNKTSARKQTLRERIVVGYGGKCGTCLAEVTSRNAWLVRKPGTTPLRHANGAGRKLTSKQKYERLLKLGCPGGWELRCPSHRDPVES